MRCLLDSHLLVWSLTGDKRVEKYREILLSPDNEIYFSAVSIWEIALKHALGKLEVDPDTALDAGMKQGFRSLNMTGEHACYAGRVSKETNNKDPFDNLLISQAKYEGMGFLTGDRRILSTDDPCIIRV